MRRPFQWRYDCVNELELLGVRVLLERAGVETRESRDGESWVLEACSEAGSVRAHELEGKILERYVKRGDKEHQARLDRRRAISAGLLWLIVLCAFSGLTVLWFNF